MTGFDYPVPLPTDERSPTYALELSDLRGAALMMRAGPTPEVLHKVVLLSYAAMKCGVATVDEVLGDRGVVHECVHHMCYGSMTPGVSIASLICMVDELEARVAEVPIETIAEKFNALPDVHGRWRIP